MKKCYTMNLHYGGIKQFQQSPSRLQWVELTVENKIWNPEIWKIGNNSFYLPSSGYLEETRPDCSLGLNKASTCRGIEILFHIPGQQLRTSTRKSEWERYETESSPIVYSMDFRLKNMEIQNAIDMSDPPCNENWTYDDEMLRKSLIGNNSCVFSHMENQSISNLCNSREEFKTFYTMDANLRKRLYQYILPCRMMTSLDFDYTEVNKTNPKHTERRPKHKKKSFQIRIAFNDLLSYKETRYVEGKLISLFIESIGLLVGLTLGLTIWKFVDYFFILKDITRGLCVRRKHHVKVKINNKIITTKEK